VPGASSSRDERSPLNVAAQAGLYAMLGTLVIASFVVTPAANVTGAPAAAAAPIVDRAVLQARSMTRPHDVEDVELSASGPSAEPIAVAVVQPEVAAASVEESPEPSPEPTAAPPTPRPAAPQPVALATDDVTAAAEARMLVLINTSRAAAGLATLAPDAGVASIARSHSGAEASVRYVYHDGPDGTAKARDVSACATGWFGENTGKIWNDNVDALHHEFMAEPWDPINHRTNIMDALFRRIGIGAVNGPDAMYMTMVFCR